MSATMVDSLKGLGRARLAIMAAVALAMIGFFSILALRVASPALTPLYTNLSLEDSGKIVSELESQGVPYEIRANGAEILVPGDRMLRLRMAMAEQNLPSGGSIVGYEIFDKSETFGSSNFVMNVNMLRALEGELSRTIGALAQIESARVHLVMPKRELFTRDKQDPTASVALKLRGGGELSKAEIQSITHLVAAAVPGLKVSRITIIDNYGRLLARGDGDDSVGAIASSAEEHRANYENRMRDTLEQLVEKIVGPGKVKVQVTADMNFDRIVTNSEKFDPEGQVARSVTSTSEREKSEDKQAKDTVSVSNQLPNSAGTPGGENAGSSHDAEKSDETTNYEISKTTQNHVKEGGNINKISVAVLVDGTYTADADGNETYAERKPEELQRITSLIKTAIGFDEKRGDTVEVVNMPFSKGTEETVEESFFDGFRHQLEGIIQTLIIAVVAVLVILLVLRPAIMHMIRTTSAPANGQGGEAMAALGGPAGNVVRLPGAGGGMGGIVAMPASIAAGPMGAESEDEESLININNIKGKVRTTSLKKVAEIVDKNPDESINVLRQWMMKEA